MDAETSTEPSAENSGYSTTPTAPTGTEGSTPPCNDGVSASTGNTAYPRMWAMGLEAAR